MKSRLALENFLANIVINPDFAWDLWMWFCPHHYSQPIRISRFLCNVQKYISLHLHRCIPSIVKVSYAIAVSKSSKAFSHGTSNFQNGIEQNIAETMVQMHKQIVYKSVASSEMAVCHSKLTYVGFCLICVRFTDTLTCYAIR